MATARLSTLGKVPELAKCRCVPLENTLYAHTLSYRGQACTRRGGPVRLKIAKCNKIRVGVVDSREAFDITYIRKKKLLQAIVLLQRIMIQFNA